MTPQLDPKLAPVIEALFAAFPDAPAPPIAQTSPRWIEEIDDAATQAKGFTWRTAPPQVLDALYDAASWLSPALFVYWLPAFLIDIAVDNRRADFRGQTIIYALTKEGPEDLPEVLRRRPQRPERTQAQYEAEVRNATEYYREIKPVAFRNNWNSMTPQQRSAVKLALQYLFERYHDGDYNKALQRWPDANQPLL